MPPLWYPPDVPRHRRPLGPCATQAHGTSLSAHLPHPVMMTHIVGFPSATLWSVPGQGSGANPSLPSAPVAYLTQGAAWGVSVNG